MSPDDSNRRIIGQSDTLGARNSPHHQFSLTVGQSSEGWREVESK